MRIVDLTETIRAGMPVYPGDPAVRIERVASLEADGFTVHRLELNSQVGTHVETQLHMLPGRRLEDEPLERFIGEAAVVDVPLRALTVRDLEPFRSLVESCPFLLLRSGYRPPADSIDPEDQRRARFEAECAEWMVARGVCLVGIDAFGFDYGPQFAAHKVFFRHGVLVLEGLRNLEALSGDRVQLFVIPLKLAEVESSPCRAFALVKGG